MAFKDTADVFERQQSLLLKNGMLRSKLTKLAPRFMPGVAGGQTFLFAGQI